MPLWNRRVHGKPRQKVKSENVTRQIGVDNWLPEIFDISQNRLV